MSSDPIVLNSIAAKFGYTPLGPRRPAFANFEPVWSATAQGANYHSLLARSIFVDEITVSMALRNTSAFPAANTQVEVLGLISWSESGDVTKADKGVAPFYPAGLFKNDGTFGTGQASGNATNINPLPGTQWAQNFLWGHIMKGTLGPTGQVGGEFGVHNTVHPNQYIQEGSILTIHMDEDMSAAIAMDTEMVIVLYYTPVKTVKITR